VTASLEKLEKEAHRIAAVMYEKTGGQGGPPADGEGGAPEAPSGGAKSKGKDGVIDAEFEETP
jgi:molecular chaperone DnaK